MKARTLLLLVVALSFVFAVDADARKRRRKKKRRKKVTVASKMTRNEIGKLRGKFKWEMSSQKVIGMLAKQIEDGYEKRLKREPDALKQDRIQREKMATLKKLKKGHVKFTGKRTPWGVSLVEKEFSHKNDESMVVRWGKRDRRFFFFHHGKLWKLYIAFNTALFRGKTFQDFAAMMQRRFGPAEVKWKLDVKGDSQMSHLEWPPAGNTVLLALDETAFYGNFCLVLIDKVAAARVREARKMNNPKKKYSDPLVNAIVPKKGGSSDPNEDVIDQITGKRSPGRTPSSGSSSSGSSSSGSSDTPRYTPQKRRKKLNPKDPLDALDI
ncbi:MAG: hypothetical protein JRH20_23670 [Deltaproteobacteria bacterium]|nr:hypothetical protein [Deltaproteobacteria bacterium]